MKLRGLILIGLICAFAIGLHAQAVTGTILIKRKLTRPSVTASVSVYQRGEVVDLGKNAAETPIEFERSRVVVYLEGPVTAGANEPAQPSPQAQQIKQLNRRFVPDMVVVPVGSTVSFPNMDPIFHNLYSLSKPKSFDLGAYDKGQTRSVTFPKPGIVQIYCHLHPNMQATVVVTPNRWYAQPDNEGRYRIPDVPPGRYTVVAWHKTAGFFRTTVVVKDGADSSADFFIPLEADPSQASRDASEPGHNAGAF